jgi:hypothetical protein
MHQSVLLLLHSFETLKVDHKDRWTFEDLKLLHCLLMQLAAAAKPGILMG